MNLTKHIRKPMPAPTSVHKGVKDSPRSKAVDLSEWEDCDADIGVAYWEGEEAPIEVIERHTEGRRWVA